MAMIELQVRDVMWCAQHGHPMLTMQLGGTDRFFAVSMAADDAASLASHPSGSAAVISSMPFSSQVIFAASIRTTQSLFASSGVAKSAPR